MNLTPFYLFVKVLLSHTNKKELNSLLSSSDLKDSMLKELSGHHPKVMNLYGKVLNHWMLLKVRYLLIVSKEITVTSWVPVLTGSAGKESFALLIMQ